MARRQAARELGRWDRTALLSVLCCLSAIWPAACVGPNIGGHFRAASLSWTKLEGNEVQFELLSSWKRSHSAHLVHGTPALGRIFLGDHVRVGGQATPRLDFGDGHMAFLDVEVTDFSEAGDWFSGVSIVNHTTPHCSGAEKRNVPTHPRSRKSSRWGRGFPSRVQEQRLRQLVCGAATSPQITLCRIVAAQARSHAPSDALSDHIPLELSTG